MKIAQITDFAELQAIPSKTLVPAEALQAAGGSSLKSSLPPRSAAFATC
jgi:hypothetical protein